MINPQNETINKIYDHFFLNNNPIHPINNPITENPKNIFIKSGTFIKTVSSSKVYFDVNDLVKKI